jgi:hypothetical protein
MPGAYSAGIVTQDPTYRQEAIQLFIELVLYVRCEP